MASVDTGSLLEDYRWLVSAAAADWLHAPELQTDQLVAAATYLRSRLSPQKAHLVLEQAALRRRAEAKFALAGELFFTSRALEQATDEVVARYKAGRFPSGALVADLCCGIGGDLMALTARGPARGVDRDPIAALLAETNCRIASHGAAGHGGSGGAPCLVEMADVSALGLSEYAAWHIDPDRRPHSRRTTRVELHEPGPEVMDRLLERQPSAAIKLAPAADPPEHWRQRGQLEWISRGRQCRQLVVWLGALAEAPGERAATVLGKTAACVRTVRGAAEAQPPIAPAVGRYLFEPDPAVLAAHLTGAIAAEHGLSSIAADVAYLTGERPVVDSALACFEVQEVLPYDVKRLRAMLRSRNIGRLEVKKRGVPIDPAQVRRQLKVSGDDAATLLLARRNGAVTAILARRMGSEEPSTRSAGE